MFRSATENSTSAYVMLPADAAEALIAAAMAGQWLARGRRGDFGSARVDAAIGGTRWPNAVYPDKESGGWFLPVKKAVRIAEKLEEGARVRVTLAL